MMVWVAVYLSGCGQSEKYGKEIKQESRDIFAMDTYMTLKVYGDYCMEALDEAEEEIKRLDELFSTGNNNSEISILNEKGSEIFSGESSYLLELSKEIYEKTEGAFDITIYPLMEEWGFTNEEYKVPQKETLEKMVKKIGTSKIHYDNKSQRISLDKGMKIDFGGIAKGYTSQRIMEIFEKYNLVGGIVSLGGNVQTWGNKGDGSHYKVGIESPFGEADYVGILEIDHKAVVTSGGYQRFFEKDGITYHHIIDPKSGYPADSGFASVTVVNEDGAKADGYSTALFVMGKEKAVNFWKTYGKKEGFEAVFVEKNGTISITSGLIDVFSSNNEYQVID